MIMVKCDWAHDHCDRMSDDDPGKALIMMKAFLFFRCHQDDEETFLLIVIVVIWCMQIDAAASICNRRSHMHDE